MYRAQRKFIRKYISLIVISQSLFELIFSLLTISRDQVRVIGAPILFQQKFPSREREGERGKTRREGERRRECRRERKDEERGREKERMRESEKFPFFLYLFENECH